MTKYEYKVVVVEQSIQQTVETHINLIEGALNPLGQEGWCVYNGGPRIFYLRREIVA